LGLAARGAEVCIVGRDAERGAQVQADLRSLSGGLGAFMQADLGLLAEARKVGAQLAARYPRLDAFIQSAGVIDFKAVSTAEGHNRLFTINFAHRAILAEALLPSLQAAGGRMLIVAADVPDKMLPDFAKLEGPRDYAGPMALPQLQSANLGLVQHYAAEWSPKVAVMAIHPGVVDTGIMRSASGGWKVLKALFGLLSIPVEKPAALLAWLAFSPEAAGYSGTMFSDPKNYAKRHQLARPQAAVDRIVAAAHSV
jgi:NAD(P)-dependent dehydrogenase (short-subunit alcohol dehydrogenase family)